MELAWRGLPDMEYSSRCALCSEQPSEKLERTRGETHKKFPDVEERGSGGCCCSCKRASNLKGIGVPAMRAHTSAAAVDYCQAVAARHQGT